MYGGVGMNTVRGYFPINCVCWFNYYDCINEQTLTCCTARFVNLQMKTVCFSYLVCGCLDYSMCSSEGQQQASNFCSELRFILFQSHLYRKIMRQMFQLGFFFKNITHILSFFLSHYLHPQQYFVFMYRHFLCSCCQFIRFCTSAL